MMALFNYLLLTNFFWMLVEGLYLHAVIVWTFSLDDVRFRYYAALGWGQWFHMFQCSPCFLFFFRLLLFFLP